MRHGTCFRRRLSAHRAGAAPHSAVAELGVVRRFLAHPLNEDQSSRSQAWPPSRRGSIRSLLPSARGAFYPQHRVSDHRMEASSVIPTTNRGTTRSRVAAASMACLASIHPRPPSRCSLGSRTHQSGWCLARSIVESPSVLSISVACPVCCHYMPSFAHAVPMNPNRPETPNHALQRTAPRVTVAAISGLGVFAPSHLCPTLVASFFAPPSQLPRHAPPSLSLRSLGVATRIL